jgi:ABC-type multidrug transport system fused ATPase/permease subunit
MSLTNLLIKNFYEKEKFSLISIIILCFAISFLKINVISYISANIIKSIKNNNIKYVYEYYNYFFIVCIIFIVLFYIYKHFQYIVSFKLRFFIRFFLFKNILFKNDEQLEDINFTKIVTPVVRISNCFDIILNIFINETLPNLTIILIIFFFFIYKNLNIALIFLFGNILLIVSLYYSSFTILNKSNNIEKNIIKNESMSSEIFNNFHKIILRGMQNNEIDSYRADINNLYKISDDYYYYINNKNLLSNIIVYGTLLILFFYLIILFFKKKITSIIFITFITILLLYKDLILSSLYAYPIFLENISRYNANVESFKIKLFNSNEKDTTYPGKATNHESLAGVEKLKLKFNQLEFKNINFKYDIEDIKLENLKIIFNNFNLKLNIENKIIGIHSLSGKGKSTLMKLLLKIYLYEGSILIDDVNIDKIDKQYLRENIIYVDQSANLFDRKIIANIFYSCKDIDFNIMNKYLDEIMQYPKIKELYYNINFEEHDAGFNGSNLSGGQRQVINIINGLISPSIITILDEPTNALDPELKKEVIQLIKDFKKYNKCIIIITHDEEIHEILDEKIEI